MISHATYGNVFTVVHYANRNYTLPRLYPGEHTLGKFGSSADLERGQGYPHFNSRVSQQFTCAADLANLWGTSHLENDIAMICDYVYPVVARRTPPDPRDESVGSRDRPISPRYTVSNT